MTVLLIVKLKHCPDYRVKWTGVWRPQGECFHLANITEYDRYGGGSVMIWGSWDRHTNLCVLDHRTIIGKCYIEDILDVHVRLYAVAVGNGFILMDGNAYTYVDPMVHEYPDRERNEQPGL